MSRHQLWDVFESESLTIRRSQTFGQIRELLSEGTLSTNDLFRPNGTDEPWRRLSEFTIDQQPIEAENRSRSSTSSAREWESARTPVEEQDLLDPNADIDIDSGENQSDLNPVGTAGKHQEKPKIPIGDLPSLELQALRWLTEDEDSTPDRPIQSEKLSPINTSSKIDDEESRSEREEMLLEPSVELELTRTDSSALFRELTEDDEEEDFSLSRSRVEHVEEMDLAAMVDIAFQLVLFFMVTASVTMIKSMELPKPTESTKPATASAPGVGTRDKNQVEDEFIVVSITSDGEMLVDDEPTRVDQLVERLRTVRNDSGKTGMLLRAENKTKHRIAVAAYDAANEIGLRIAIEREMTDK